MLVRTLSENGSCTGDDSLYNNSATLAFARSSPVSLRGAPEALLVCTLQLESLYAQISTTLEEESALRQTFLSENWEISRADR